MINECDWYFGYFSLSLCLANRILKIHRGLLPFVVASLLLTKFPFVAFALRPSSPLGEKKPPIFQPFESAYSVEKIEIHISISSELVIKSCFLRPSPLLFSTQPHFLSRSPLVFGTIKMATPKATQVDVEATAVPYEALEGGMQQPAYSYYVIPTEPRRRKQCGSCCCLTSLAIFLICFFLIPRTPLVELKSVEFPQSDDASSGVGKFLFTNYDFYPVYYFIFTPISQYSVINALLAYILFQVEWENAEIDMYWVPYSKTNAQWGTTCWPADSSCPSGKYFGIQCMMKLGSFEKTSSFKTPGRSSNTEKYTMVEKGEAEIQCTKNMLLSVREGGQLLVASGHVENKVRISYVYNIYFALF